MTNLRRKANSVFPQFRKHFLKKSCLASALQITLCADCVYDERRFQRAVPGAGEVLNFEIPWRNTKLKRLDLFVLKRSTPLLWSGLTKWVTAIEKTYAIFKFIFKWHGYPLVCLDRRWPSHDGVEIYALAAARIVYVIVYRWCFAWAPTSNLQHAYGDMVPLWMAQQIVG